MRKLLSRRSGVHKTAGRYPIYLSLLLILCAMPFALSSCAVKDAALGKNAASRLTGGFSCTAAVDWNGNSYEVKISRPSAGSCKINFVKPDDLSKMSIESGEGVVTIQFGDLGVTVDPDTLPETALFNAVMNSFDSCATPDNITAAQQDGNIRITGKAASGNFVLTLSDNYTPLTLEVPDEQMKLKFENFKYA